MKQFTIQVHENKANLFVELMESISFVRLIKEEKVSDIPEEHKSVVRERIHQYGVKTDKYLDWSEIEEKLNQIQKRKKQL